MRKEKILEILENAKDGNGAVPMRLVRTAFDKLPEPCEDTISRQAAIDALDFEIVHMTAYCDGKNEGNPLAQYNRGLEDGKKAIEALPSAQPEPHEGHWIRTDCGLDVECKCSECGYKDFVEPRDEYWFKRNYCPYCGARMKGERQ